MSTETREISIKSIRRGSKKRVFDIGVENNHNFIANGFVVSNCFQEQFMLMAQDLAGFSPAEGDKLRKTLVKKSVEKLDAIYKERQDARDKFIKGAKNVSNISEDIATSLWEEIDFFAQYGFNKSLLFNTMIDVFNNQGKYIDTKQIKDIIPGSFVKSRDETTKEEILVQVESLHDHGKIPTFEITLDNGKKVTCSMHHKFRTKNNEMHPLWYILQEDLEIINI